MSLPRIRQLLDIYGLAAQKHLSQNFILNTHTLHKIASLLHSPTTNGPPSHILEIGPGPGSLTRALLDRKPASLLAVELDQRFQPLLQQLEESSEGVLRVFFGNALDLHKYLPLSPQNSHLSVVGNLPFAVASLLLQRLLRSFQDPLAPPHEFILMFQFEVAQRIVAQAGDKKYGRLALASQNAYETSIAMTVPRSEFVPKPKVDAAVVKFKSRPTEYLQSSSIPYDDMSFLTGKLFQSRGRMVSGILRSHGISDWDSSILPFSPTLRPAAMTLHHYQSLGRWLRSTHPDFFASCKGISNDQQTYS